MMKHFAYDDPDLLLEVAVKVKRFTKSEREHEVLFWAVLGKDVDD